METIRRMVGIVGLLEINCEREKCMKFAVNNKTNTKYFPLWVPFQHGANGKVEELWVICKDSFCISYRENCELDIIFTEMTDGEAVNGRDLAVSFEFQELLAAVATENREDPLAEMLTQYIKLDFPENGVSKEMDSDEIARTLQEKTGIEARTTILGHVQRGGSPTVRDRVVASQMGYYAVDLLSQGIGNRVVGMQAGKIVDFDIQEALSMKKPYEEELHQIAREIAI